VTDWNPIVAGADPTQGWYSEQQLDRQRRADEANRDFRRMVARRNRFEAHCLEVTPTTDQQRAALWELAQQEID